MPGEADASTDLKRPDSLTHTKRAGGISNSAQYLIRHGVVTVGSDYSH